MQSEIGLETDVLRSNALAWRAIATRACGQYVGYGTTRASDSEYLATVRGG